MSPANARQRLAAFIKGAKRELLIYDLKISDRAMLRVLEERFRAGVQIRVIGEVPRSKELPVRRLQGLRLHTRLIIRDRQTAFLGSQSLRKLELDERREVGIIVGGTKVVSSLIAVFKEDWRISLPRKPERRQAESQAEEKAARKVAKAVTRKLPVAPVIKQVVRVMGKQTNVPVGHKTIKRAVEAEVKSALKKAVKKAATKVVHNPGAEL